MSRDRLDEADVTQNLGSRLDLSVLYVEDDEVTRKTVASVLSRRIRKVIVADDGVDGIEKYKAEFPEIVVTDIYMPRLDGLQMAREIKKLNMNAHIILMTAYSDIEYMMKAIDIGIDGYVVKPIDYEELIHTIYKSANYVNLENEINRRNTEREQLLKDLEEARNRIRALERLIHLCPSCNRVKDEKGYWKQLESYLKEHSGSEQPQSLCPDCERKAAPAVNSN